MVRAVRRGKSRRQVAREFGVSLATVQRWLARAGEGRLDRADLADRKSGCRPGSRRTATKSERVILELRRELREESDLGEFGAIAIRRAMIERDHASPPSVRTIGRILERCGALDGRRRPRRKAPPRGWYLPDLARGDAELDSFDIVEGLVIEGGTDFEVLNGCSLHGGLVESWPRRRITAKNTVESLIEHWRDNGLPDYAQFDNDTIFQGAHQFPDSVGRVTRLCLSLDVVPVFAPPRETGFQAAIESYNNQWQEKVWHRFHHDCLRDVQRTSVRYVNAHRLRNTERIDSIERWEFPRRWSPDLAAPLAGRIIYLRRTDEHGVAQVLGHRFPVSRDWPHRLVRAEVDLDRDRIRFHALRRRAPTEQPLLAEVSHHLPRKRFQG